MPDGTLWETPPIPRLVVPTADIATQRSAGWPDFHPETYCHRCGGRNVRSWFTDASMWNLVAGVGDILCPQCFTELVEHLTGPVTWELRVPVQLERKWTGDPDA